MMMRDASEIPIPGHMHPITGLVKAGEGVRCAVQGGVPVMGECSGRDDPPCVDGGRGGNFQNPLAGCICLGERSMTTCCDQEERERDP